MLNGFYEEQKNEKISFYTLYYCDDSYVSFLRKKSEVEVQKQAQTDQMSTDDGWILPGTLEMTEEMSKLFSNVTEGISDKKKA